MWGCRPIRGCDAFETRLVFMHVHVTHLPSLVIGSLASWFSVLYFPSTVHRVKEVASEDHPSRNNVAGWAHGLTSYLINEDNLTALFSV